MTSDDTSQLETCHYFNIKTNIVINALSPKQNNHFITRSSHNFIRCRSRILHLLYSVNTLVSMSMIATQRKTVVYQI